MIVRGVGEHDLRAALGVANYAYRENLRFKEGPEPMTASRRSWRFRLGVKDPEGPGHRRRVARSWWDRSWWEPKGRGMTGSACYHAHRDFVYAMFERAPEASVVTALAVYEGLRNFESSYQRVGKRNVGSFFEPVRLEDCCDCSKKFPWIEEMVPEAYLTEECALKPDREIYSGLNASRRR